MLKLPILRPVCLLKGSASGERSLGVPYLVSQGLGTIPIPLTATGPFLPINKQGAADGNIPFIVDAVSGYIV